MRGCKDGGSRIGSNDRLAWEALDGLPVGGTCRGRCWTVAPNRLFFGGLTRPTGRAPVAATLTVEALRPLRKDQACVPQADRCAGLVVNRRPSR